MRIVPLIAGFACIGLLVLGCPTSSVAETARPEIQESQLCPFCQKANDQQASYADKAGNTLIRGALNAAFGWTEVIRLPAKEAQEGGNLFVGVANGIGAGIARTLTGLGEVLTFWTPRIGQHYIHFSKDCPLDVKD